MSLVLKHVDDAIHFVFPLLHLVNKYAHLLLVQVSWRNPVDFHWLIYLIDFAFHHEELNIVNFYITLTCNQAKC
jgi:hypothetical protein